MDNNLKFVNTFTIKEFLMANEASNIDFFKPSEDGNEPFFRTNNKIIGTIGDNADVDDLNKSRISTIESPEGNSWLMMHAAPSNQLRPTVSIDDL